MTVFLPAKRLTLTACSDISTPFSSIISLHSSRASFDIRFTPFFLAIRSNVAAERLTERELVRSYKLLARVEQAFRSLKSVDLQVRPIRHRLADRVRAHVFICVLAYYVRWHLERAWAPLLFRDEEPPVADDPVAPARRSPGALAKARTGRREDGQPVYSFRGLLDELATLTKNTIRVPGSAATFSKLALPTPLHSEALRLLGLEARM